MTTDFEVEIPCPHCGTLHECASAANTREKQPKPGDVAICWDCAAPLKFTLNPLGVLTLRPLTVEEEAEVQNDPDVAVLLDAMRRVRTASGAAREALNQIEEA